MHTKKKTAMAILLVLDQDKTPYQAAKEIGIHLTTMYKNPLYMMLKEGKVDELRKEITKIMLGASNKYLPREERAVIARKHADGMQVSSIAKEYKMSAERIRQIIQQEKQLPIDIK